MRFHNPNRPAGPRSHSPRAADSVGGPAGVRVRAYDIIGTPAEALMVKLS